MKQKDLFLASEGDAWFKRNHAAVCSKDFSKDAIVQEVLNINSAWQKEVSSSPINILEVGCGEAARLEFIGSKINANCCGVEPSSLAVEQAKLRGINAVRGSAECLEFDSDCFDIVIYGFCLYLCDRSDLLCIAKEADRVLKSNGWVIIHDFFSISPMQLDYTHKKEISSYKMDYRKLFDWHPFYNCYSHILRHHISREFTDDSNEWVATSVLRKRSCL